MLNNQQRFHSQFFYLQPLPNTSQEFPALENSSSLSELMDNCENSRDFLQQQDHQDKDTNPVREIEETSLEEVIRPKTRKQGCHCKKTRCLKMYCECFSQGRPCEKNCVCIGCHNTQKLTRSKDDKQNRPVNLPKVSSAQIAQCAIPQSASSSRRCNCKKSHCQKRYCQCFNSGNKCSGQCQCIQCNNTLLFFTQQQNPKTPLLVQQNPQTLSQHDKQTQQIIQQFEQIINQPVMSYLIMSNQLLAQIDGYLTA